MSGNLPNKRQMQPTFRMDVFGVVEAGTDEALAMSTFSPG